LPDQSRRTPTALGAKQYFSESSHWGDLNMGAVNSYPKPAIKAALFAWRFSLAYGLKQLRGSEPWIWPPKVVGQFYVRSEISDTQFL